MILDEELVKRCLSGDDAAFSKIINRYKAYVFAIILKFISNYDETENIAQEVFLQIYRSLPQYGFKNFKSWIGKIAVNKAIDYKRKNTNYLQEKNIEDANIIANEENTPYHNPEDTLLQKEKRERIYKIYKTIPKIYSTVMFKFYIEGKSYKEIASEEGVPLKTIASRLYRGRNLFKKKWGENK